MSTTPISTWAVDLADVDKIYPWVGSEMIMAVIGLVLWLLWHVWQLKHENEEYRRKVADHANEENIRKSVADG